MIATTELHATAEMKRSLLGAARHRSAPDSSVGRNRLSTLFFRFESSHHSSSASWLSVSVLSFVILLSLFFSPAACGASRFLTRADVLRAIRVSLENNPGFDPASIDFSTLEMSAQI